MIRRPPRSTLDRSSAASDVYKRQGMKVGEGNFAEGTGILVGYNDNGKKNHEVNYVKNLSLIHISEPTRPY